MNLSPDKQSLQTGTPSESTRKSEVIGPESRNMHFSKQTQPLLVKLELDKPSNNRIPSGDISLRHFIEQLSGTIQVPNKQMPIDQSDDQRMKLFPKKWRVLGYGRLDEVGKQRWIGPYLTMEPIKGLLCESFGAEIGEF
ncbi:hypothetical protein V6N11_077382 [Hibiscus sabdariffa]|uniref:Uncharacterized protein n=1 Tax=Hibiscus sabdariffa TaxID=183260 RepID=A0ABR2TCY1_9ROSI